MQVDSLAEAWMPRSGNKVRWRRIKKPTRCPALPPASSSPAKTRSLQISGNNGQLGKKYHHRWR